MQLQMYRFNELSKDVQKKVLDDHRYDDVEGDWWLQDVVSNFKEQCAEYGITVDDDNIYYDLSHSQGSGVSFVSDEIDLVAFVTKAGIKLPFWDKLKSLYYTTYHLVIEKGPDGYRYTHKSTVVPECVGNIDSPIANRLVDELGAVKDMLCDKLYLALDREYDMYTSDAHIAVFLQEDFYFTADGKYSVSIY